MVSKVLHVISPNGVIFEGKSFRCATGKGGFSHHKVEGDGATPTGIFPIREVFYRPDRIVPPPCELPIRPLEKNDGWCDDPKDVNYNRFIRHPYPSSAEHLWREDHVYDLILVVGYNDDPIIAGKGSAIFIHCARDNFSPTEGCVAFSEKDLLWILEHLKPESYLHVDERLAVEVEKNS